MFLELASFCRAHIVHSLQNTFKVSIDDEWRLQLFCDVGKLDGGVFGEECFLTAVHVAFILMSDEQVLLREAVQAESAEMVSNFILRDLVG